jgi:CubicO group peptidase (beta-lactamase class C family)
MNKWIESARVEKRPEPKGATMRVRMLRTHTSGVEGGMRVMTFEAGKSYDVEDAVALSFLKYGHAVEDKMVAVPETKAVEPVVEIEVETKEAVEPEPPVTKPHKAHKRGRK